MARQESEIWYVRMPRCWLLYITQVWPTGIDDVERIFSSQTRHFLWHERKFLWHAKRSLSTESRSIVGLRWCLSLFWVFRKKNKKQRLVWEERTGECRTCIIYLFSVCIHKTFFALLADGVLHSHFELKTPFWTMRNWSDRLMSSFRNFWQLHKSGVAHFTSQARAHNCWSTKIPSNYGDLTSEMYRWPIKSGANWEYLFVELE